MCRLNVFGSYCLPFRGRSVRLLVSIVKSECIPEKSIMFGLFIFDLFICYLFGHVTGLEMVIGSFFVELCLK